LRVLVLAVGKPGAVLREAIQHYEQRAARYWPLETVEVREEKATPNSSAERVRALEGERLLERVPSGSDLSALSRKGTSWGSDQLARHLQRCALSAQPAVFLIGGAFGLSDDALERATRQISLSSFTLPHELARLVLAEQLYRAGTIARGEPYHKARP
jgi:23S rRNA (pseudouridine1915-N3)-methyltransferase